MASGGKASNVQVTRREIPEDAPPPEMDEEKAKELCKLLERLEQRGLVQVVRKSDQDRKQDDEDKSEEKSS